MLQEMAKLRRIRELKLPDNLFPGIAHKVLSVYRNRASIEEPSRLRAHSRAKRLTYLAALCFLRAQEITDALVDLLIHIARIRGRRSVAQILAVNGFDSAEEQCRLCPVDLENTRNS